MAKKQTLHSLSIEILTHDDQENFRRELFGGTDRSAALVGASMVDSTLVFALQANFIFLGEEETYTYFHGQNAMLGTLASRINMAYVLGVYDDKYKSYLNAIRRVRNVFAHGMRPINFDHELISKECGKLPEPDWSRTKDYVPRNTPRERYVMFCIQAWMKLLRYAGDKMHDMKGREPVILG